jgi:hypothetical protein
MEPEWINNAVTRATANEADEPSPEAVGIVVVNAKSYGVSVLNQVKFELNTKEYASEHIQLPF